MSSRLTSSDPEMTSFKGAIVFNGIENGVTGTDRALLAAKKAKETYNADVSVAAVEPCTSEGKPRGTVYLGVMIRDTSFVEEVGLPGDRNRLRNYAVISLMNYCRKLMS